jgi:hypothetical protein
MHIFCFSVATLYGTSALSTNLFIVVNTSSVHPAVFISANEKYKFHFHAIMYNKPVARSSL